LILSGAMILTINHQCEQGLFIVFEIFIGYPYDKLPLFFISGLQDSIGWIRNRNAKLFITGISGFAGGHIFRYLFFLKMPLFLLPHPSQ
jgi:hypothetical protein